MMIRSQAIETAERNFFCFEHQMTYFDLNFGLMLTKEIVRTHFRAVRIPDETQKIERLYFTDKKNTGWCVQSQCLIITT